MKNLINKISTTIINTANEFKFDDNQVKMLIINTSLEKSLVEPMKKEQPFLLDENVEVGDDIALAYLKKPGDVKITNIFYFLDDYRLVDLKPDKKYKGRYKAILNNKITGETHTIYNLIRSNISNPETEDLATRLQIINTKYAPKPLMKNDSVESLKDIYFKFFNIVSDNNNPDFNNMLIIADKKVLKLTQVELELSDEIFAIRKNDNTYGVRGMTVTGVVNKIRFTEDNPLIFLITAREYKELKTLSLTLS